MPYTEPTTTEPTPETRQLAQWRKRAYAAEAEVDQLRAFFADGIDAYDARAYGTGGLGGPTN